MSEDETRARIVAEAKSWVRTPYHSNARIKGAGCDCMTLIAEVYKSCGLAVDFVAPPYNADRHFHVSDEHYLAGLAPYSEERPGPPQRIPKPGDLALWKFGRSYSHGAIVIQWPNIIHAWSQAKMVTPENAEAASYLNFIGEEPGDKPRPRKILVVKGWS